jgi:EAL domain-containing protein (putative c-di-GMP-specific phosphodiesterase class I)
MNSYTAKIVSVEALCRWNNNRLGAISPVEFILSQKSWTLFMILASLFSVRLVLMFSVSHQTGLTQ